MPMVYLSGTNSNCYLKGPLGNVGKLNRKEYTTHSIISEAGFHFCGAAML